MNRLTNLQQLALENKAGAEDLRELEALEAQLFQTYHDIRTGHDLPTTDELRSASGELYGGERLAELMQLAGQGAPAEDALRRASRKALREKRLHAFPRRAFAWRIAGDGEEVLYKLIYRSQPGACWAALCALLSGEMRALLLRTRQYVLDLPNGPIEPELAAEHGLPTDPGRLMASAHLLLEKWTRDYEREAAMGRTGRREAFKLIPAWEELQTGPLSPERRERFLKKTHLWEMQRAYALLRLECALEEGGLTAVDAKPYAAARHAAEEFREDGRLKKVYVTRVPEISSSVVTAVDERLIGERGIVRDVSRLPYSTLSFSNAGIDPRTGAADFRVVWGIPVDARAMNAVSVILDHGAWKQDGASYVIGADPGHVAWQAEFQFRAGQQIATTKGVLLPLYPEYVEERLKITEKAVRVYERMAAAEPDDSPEGAQYVLEALFLKRMLKEGAPALRRMLARWKQISHKPRERRRVQGVALFARGDQIKVPLGEHEGPWLLAGTHLRGRVYDMAFNSQGLQLLQMSAARPLRGFMEQVVREDLYYPLLTPEGIAGALDRRIGAVVGAASGDVTQELGELDMADLESLDTLRLACLSNVIRHTSGGRSARLKGEAPQPGQLRVPGTAMLRLLDAVWAGRAAATLRSWGLSLRAGLLLTCEDSVSTWKRLSGCGGEESGLARAASPVALYAERGAGSNHERITVRQFRDLAMEDRAEWRLVYGRRKEAAPKFYVPQAIARLINGDNDGDIVGGMAADVALRSDDPAKDGRVVKLVLILRYPVVDAPVLWLLPAGTKTPWDAPEREVVHAGMSREEILSAAQGLSGRYPQLAELRLKSRRQYPAARLVGLVNDAVNQQARRYREFLQIFGAEVPVGPGGVEADLYGDDIVLARSKLVRIMDVGIKSTFVKKKAEGPATHRAALDMCYRKAERSSTGRFTRGHERLAVRALYALAMYEKKRAENLPAEHWKREFGEWARRLRDSGVCIEDQVTGFKHILDSDPRFPSLYLYDDAGPGTGPAGKGRDRLFSDAQEAARAIPVDYHARLANLKHILERFRDRSAPYEALETMDYFGAEPGSKHYGTVGKESMILNKLLDTALADVYAAFAAIKTDLAPYVKELDDRIKGITPTPEIEEERYAAVAQLDSWSPFWRGEDGAGGVMEHYYEILSEGGVAETEEAVKRADDFRRRAAQAKKDALRAFGESISLDALTLAVADQWSEDGLARTGWDEAPYTKRVNATPAIAMMGRRITEVFPRPNLTVELERARQKQLVVYTTQAELDLQGLRLSYTGGEKIGFDRLAYSPAENLFLMRLGEKIVPWHLADNQEVDLEAIGASSPRGWHLVAVGGKRAVLYME